MGLSGVFSAFRSVKSNVKPTQQPGAKPADYSLPAYPREGNTLVPLLNSKDIFSAENSLIGKANAGDEIWLSIYELQNEKINGKDRSSKGAEGYLEQQQVIPSLVAAKARGADVHVVVDVSKFDEKPSQNLSMMRYLKRNGIDIRPYPAKFAKINHSKNLVVIHHQRHGKTEYWGMGGGGMNVGNHSASNHDTMILMAGLAPYNMLVHVIRPQWGVCGGDVSALPDHEVEDPEVRWLNTAPPEENGGTAQSEIKQAYIKLARKALDLIQQGYTPHIRTSQFVLSNPAVAYFLRDVALVGGDVQVLLDPNIYADQANQQWQWETWARQVLESGGVKVRFFNADVKTQQKLHDKWISLTYTGADGKEVPVELLTGSANASKAGLEPAGPIGFKSPSSSSKTRLAFIDEPLIVSEDEEEPPPSSGFAGLMSAIGKRIPFLMFNQTAAKAGKKTGKPGGFFRRTNREADALIFNHDVIRAYNDHFDNLMATRSTPEPPSGSGFSTIF